MNAAVLATLARRQRALGNHVAAVQTYCRALGLEPDSADLHAELALALLSSRRLTAARLEAELAVGNAPELPMAVYALAAVRVAERRWADADALHERLLALEPDDPENHLAWARSLVLRHRRAEARARLEAGLAVDPEHVASLEELAELDLLEGKVDEAERRVREALTLSPEHGDSLVTLGMVSLRRGDITAAWDLAVQVLRADPSDHRALHLVVAVKARRSVLLGLWWRYAVWMASLGTRMYVVLLGGYLTYRVASIAAAQAWGGRADDLVAVLWFGLCAWTWVSPALFRRRLQKELEPVALSRDF